MTPLERAHAAPPHARHARTRLDGRVHRTLRSRRAICEACLDLIQEGVLQPGADQVAERAGLSRRSIFNHFADLAELYDAVVEAGLQRCAPLLKEVPPDAPLERRIELASEIRSNFLEAAAPFTRALGAQSLAGPASEPALRVLKDGATRQRDDLGRIFADVLEGRSASERLEIVEAMVAATSPATWEFLRRSRGLSHARARGVVRRTLAALLTTAEEAS